MISSIIKLSVSDFVLRILQNDAERFGFLNKEKEPNLNGLLNKLIPNLLYYRKVRRDEIHRILNENFARNDRKSHYEQIRNDFFCAKVNTISPPTTFPYKLSVVFLLAKAYCSIADSPWRCFFSAECRVKSAELRLILLNAKSSLTFA